MLRHFIIKEFVPPDIYSTYGDQSIALLEYDLLYTIDDLREFFDKPITVNNWHINGNFKYRGFRPSTYKYGAVNSPHKEGIALDFDVKGLTAEEGRQLILENQKLFPFIKRMEADVNWIHIDMVNTGKKEIILFHP